MSFEYQHAPLCPQKAEHNPGTCPACGYVVLAFEPSEAERITLHLGWVKLPGQTGMPHEAREYRDGSGQHVPLRTALLYAIRRLG